MRRSRPTGSIRSGLAVAGLAAALAIVLGACGGSGSTSAPAGNGSSLTVDLTGSGGVAPGASVDPASIVGWPATAPADVPAFPGKLENIMVGRRTQNAFGVRMFFSNVSRDQFSAYLGSLRAAGFKLQGIVLYSNDTAEGQAAARRRADSGDIDTVIATNDPRRLNISVPRSDGRVTFDLDGLTKAENDAMNVVAWPAAWAAKVPAPDECTLDSTSILSNDSTGFKLMCIYPAADKTTRDRVLSAYQAKLAAAGFQTTDKTGGTYYLKLSNGTIDLTIYPDMAGRMSIEAAAKPNLSGGWPADWISRVPPPDGCTLGPNDIIFYATTGINIACTYVDNDPAHHQQVLEAYTQKLVAAGFTVTSVDHQGSRLPNGVSAVHLARGSVKVNVMPDGAPNGMSIGATDGE
jgi:hypothetical protein